MKNVTTKLMIVAAALAAAAQLAPAQTEKMEAKIPFAFRISGKVLAPGTYQVRMLSQSSGGKLIVLNGKGQSYEALTFAYPNGDAKAAWTASGNAILEFQCGVSRCALDQVWMGDPSVPAYRVPVPKLGKDEPVHTAEIVLQRVKTD